MSGLLDVMDDLPIRFEFIVIWRDSAVFGVCVKFVSCFL